MENKTMNKVDQAEMIEVLKSLDNRLKAIEKKVDTLTEDELQEFRTLQ